MKYDNETYFSCYSPNLKEFLEDIGIVGICPVLLVEDNGFEVIKKFVHIKKDTTCWVFKRDERLSLFLSQWSKNRQRITA